METWQGKHFSITDPKGVNTVIYQINETEKQFLKDSPKYTVDRLDFTEEIRGEMTRKTFYLNNPSVDEDQLIILSFGQEKVVVNMALLKDDKITMSKKPIPLKLNNIYSEQAQEIKEVRYSLYKKEDFLVYNVILGIVIVLSVILIFTIMIQPSKQNSAASAFSGGADQLFGKQKARGFEAVMQRATAVLGAIWMILLFVLSFLSSK